MTNLISISHPKKNAATTELVERRAVIDLFLSYMNTPGTPDNDIMSQAYCDEETKFFKSPVKDIDDLALKVDYARRSLGGSADQIGDAVYSSEEGFILCHLMHDIEILARPAVIENGLTELAQTYWACWKQLSECSKAEDETDHDTAERKAAVQLTEKASDIASKAETAIMDYPACTIQELVIKARLAELRNGNGYIAGSAKSEISALARDLERMAGIQTPPADGKVFDLLYGFHKDMSLQKAA